MSAAGLPKVQPPGGNFGNLARGGMDTPANMHWQTMAEGQS